MPESKCRVSGNRFCFWARSLSLTTAASAASLHDFLWCTPLCVCVGGGGGGGGNWNTMEQEWEYYGTGMVYKLEEDTWNVNEMVEWE